MKHFLSIKLFKLSLQPHRIEKIYTFFFMIVSMLIIWSIYDDKLFPFFK